MDYPIHIASIYLAKSIKRNRINAHEYYKEITLRPMSNQAMTQKGRDIEKLVNKS